MKYLFSISFLMLLITSCNSQEKSQSAPWLMNGLSYDVIFQEGDSVQMANGQWVPSKDDLDLIVLKDNHLFVSHECADANNDLGDGGQMTKINLETGHKTAIDFSSVNGTWLNCGGSLGPDGMIYTCEEFPPSNNARLHKNGLGYQDTSQVSEYARYLDFGWVVQVDPKSGKAVQKMYGFGRASHEDVHFLPDGKTVYVSDDFMPAVLYKFVADQKHDFTKGQLYALKMEGNKGTWLPMPMERDSLNNARVVASRLGATLFARHEWLTFDGANLYIAETGYHNMKYQSYLDKGANMAWYFEAFKNADSNRYEDNYGRILRLNVSTNEMEVVIEGGTSVHHNMSNPDCIEYVAKNGAPYLFICEDLSGPNKTRNNQLLRHNLETGVTDIIMEVPQGAESTGLCFDHKNDYLYVNIQHPSPNNQAPFDKASTIRIKGLF